MKKIFIFCVFVIFIILPLMTKADTSILECDNMANDQSALSCYTKYAIQYKNASICEKVKGTNDYTSQGIPLKYFCYRGYATQLNDYKTCPEVYKDEINDCYSTIAKSLNNSEICEQIKNKGKKEICYEQFGIFSGKCAKEGQKFSRVYRNEYPTHCCQGLIEWDSGMDTRKVKDGKCVSTGLMSGYPVGTCIKCGDKICDKYENICNCPQDCQNSANNNAQVFNDNEVFSKLVNWLKNLFWK